MDVDQLLEGRGNLKDTYISCLEEHRVLVKGQPFYLIKTFYGTNTRKDFLQTYAKSLDKDLLEKATSIPDAVEYNEYAVLYDTSLNVVAVFNMEFAHYDPDLQRVTFRAPVDVLISYWKKTHKASQDTKSVAEKVATKLDTCREKVINKVASENGNVIAPQSGESALLEGYTPSWELAEKEREKEEKGREERKKGGFMEHAIMYAAAPPVKR